MKLSFRACAITLAALVIAAWTAPANAAGSSARANPNVAQGSILLSAGCFGPYEFVNNGAGRVWDIRGGTPATNSLIQMYNRHGGWNQKWNLCNNGGSSYTIVNPDSGKCVDIWGAQTTDQAVVQLYPCHGGPNQQFNITFVSSNGYRFQAVHSAKCLDIPGPNYGNGVALQQYTCHSGLNQLFRLISA